MSKKGESLLEDKLDSKTKLLYGISNLGSGTVSGIFATSLIFFYVEKLLLDEIYIAWAFTFYAIWNAVNDPLFGWLSDKTRTRWGRRIPYLRIFTPLLAISFILVWFSPTTGEIGQFGVFIWLLLSMLLYDTAYTASYLVYCALGQELSMDHGERAKAQAISMGLQFIGTIISLLLPDLFLEDPGTKSFLLLVIILAIMQLITMGITSLTIKERLEFSHVDEPLGIYQAFKHTIKSKSFIITVLTNFCMIFVQSVVLGNLFFTINYVYWGWSSTTIILLFGGLLIVGIVIGMIYILKIDAKMGLKTALLRSILFLGIGLILLGALPDLLSLIGIFVMGIGFAGVMTLMNTAFGEVADEDEVKTGVRREAAIFGTNSLITKPAQSVAGAFIALMLVFFGYQAPIGGVPQQQTDFTVLGLKLAIGIIPGLVILAAGLIFLLYPLHGSYLTEIKTKMNSMHAEKKKKYDSTYPRELKK